MDNLQELNIRSVSVDGGISLDEGGYERLSSVLSKHQDNWPRRRIDKLGLYEVDGIRHHLLLDIEIIRRVNPEVALFALEAHPFSRGERLRASTRARQELQFSEIQAILSNLGDIELRSQLHSHLGWDFPPDAKKPIIGLPLMTVQNDVMPFTEISGIRLKKITAEGLTTVTIDLRVDRSLAVTSAFPLPGAAISEKIIDDTAKLGTQVIGNFVFDADDSLESRERQS